MLRKILITLALVLATFTASINTATACGSYTRLSTQDRVAVEAAQEAASTLSKTAQFAREAADAAAVRLETLEGSKTDIATLSKARSEHLRLDAIATAQGHAAQAAWNHAWTLESEAMHRAMIRDAKAQDNVHASAE